jgi:hypothetical protein
VFPDDLSGKPREIVPGHGPVELASLTREFQVPE